MSDTGTDWAATADALEARANFVDPYALLSDEDLDNMRLAAVGLRRLAQLDTAIGPPMRLMDLMARGTTMDAEGDELAERLTLIYVAAVAEGAEDRGQTHTQGDDRPMSGFVFWKFVHNTLIHPALGLCGPWNGPGWLLAAHDWTAERCRGAG